MYLSQRITGIIALLYIIQHVWRQRFSGVSLPEHPGAAFHKVQVELSNPWMLAVYVIAMIATTWHFAYGIWLFAAKWGITPGEKARKKFGYVCALVGIALCLMGLASIYGIVSAPPRPPMTSCPSKPPAWCSPRMLCPRQIPLHCHPSRSGGSAFVLRVLLRARLQPCHTTPKDRPGL